MNGSATESGGQAELHPDREQLAQFIDAMFRHADEGTFVSLRCFPEARDQKTLPIITSSQLNGDPGKLVDEAVHMAQVAVDQAAPWAFAPPIASFRIPLKAREADLACGLVLSVEADHDPARARQRLEFLLGPATVVVASGGQWTDPATGEVQDKLHLHWRLREPARTTEEHAALKQARDLACTQVGADPTTKTIVHPLRWPGSWHRKAEPRLCRIVALTDSELDLGEALDVLSDLHPGEGAGGASQRSGNGQSTAGTHSIGGRLSLERTFAAIERAEAPGNGGIWRFHMLRIIRSLIGRGERDDIILAVCRQATWTKSGWSHPQTDEFVREQIKADRAKDNKPEPDEHPAEDFDFDSPAPPESWPEPVDVLGAPELTGWPELTSECLPAPLYDFVTAEAERMNVDPCALAAHVISACTVSISDAWRAKPKKNDSYTQKARIWTCVVKDVGARGSDMIQSAFRPITERQISLHGAWCRKHADWKIRQAARKKADPADPEPKPSRLVTSDATIEKASDILAEGDEHAKLALMCDELAAFLEGFERYSQGGSGRAQWLEILRWRREMDRPDQARQHLR